MNAFNIAACKQAIFKTGEISIHHFGITHQRENKRHIDINARRDGLTNGRNTRFCGWDLDHQVRLLNDLPQMFGLRNGLPAIVCKIRADLKAHVTVGAIRLFIQRHKELAGSFDVFNSKLPEYFFGIPARPGKRCKRGIIIVRFRDGIVEDSWVGRHAANVTALDHGFEFAIFE